DYCSIGGAQCQYRNPHHSRSLGFLCLRQRNRGIVVHEKPARHAKKLNVCSTETFKESARVTGWPHPWPEARSSQQLSAAPCQWLQKRGGLVDWSGRQGRYLAGGSPAVPVTRFRH